MLDREREQKHEDMEREITKWGDKRGRWLRASNTSKCFLSQDTREIYSICLPIDDLETQWVFVCNRGGEQNEKK